MIWVVCSLVMTQFASAAEFSPDLEYQLDHADKYDLISAIVILESPIDIQALDAKLHDQRAPLAKRHAEVLDALHYNADMTQPRFRAELDDAMAASAVVGYTAYWIENLFVLQGTKEFIETLRGRMDIRFVTENFQAELIEPQRIPEKPGYDFRRENDRNPLDTRFVPPGITAIGALRVNEELGITGQGVLVANCDTGVDGNHVALASRWRGLTEPWQECWRDALGGGTQFPSDGNGHGTHVMGTITGRGVVGVDTQWVGCAPAAKWIATNSINQGVGGGFDNDIIADYQWFADPDGNGGTLDDVPDVIQNSWGVNTGLGYAQCFNMWNTVILNCEAAGPVVTWSAGNEAASGLRSPAIYSINQYQIFSVGAVDAQDGLPPFPIASFSSLGPTPCTPAVPDNIKPEISAPGVNVYSSVPGGGYSGTYSGTSMAGPHVAGVVALMREACPDCDHQSIKQAIMNTALDQGAAGQDNTYGWGVIRAYEAVTSVSNLGRIGGVVRDALNNPISGALVRNPAGTQSTLTDAGGQYYIPLQAGTYSMEYSKFGYTTQTINGLVVVTGDTTVQNVVLQLAPTGTVSGTVTDCAGGPAVGAAVQILNTPIPSTTTNGAGFYSFASVPQGTYDMSATGAGCGAATVSGVVVGANTTQNFTLPSDPRFECSLPDGAGYIACENGDGGGPTFSWLEVAPLAGGPGTNSGLTLDDESVNVALPFTVRFYNNNYTSINICSNGFASFTSTSNEYLNGSLPSATIGNAVVPFWDDLYLPSGGSQVAYYYLAAQQAFIIEWYSIQHFPGSDPRETFQVWLFDVNAGGGPNGNSKILYQYNTISAGTSATVGTTASPNANQYQSDATLDPSSQGLSNAHAIQYGLACPGSPEIAVNPGSLNITVPAGASDTISFQVCNTGTCPLFYNISFTQVSPLFMPGQFPLPVLTIPAVEDAFEAKGEEGRRGRDQLDAQGGPDAFGYTWKDSAEPDGPVFSWFNIAGVGTNANLPEDDRAATIPLPFSFRFYGSNYNSISVCTNGYLQLGASDTAWANRTIPTAAIPNAFIAPFWDDLNLEAGQGDIFYYHDAVNNRFIVQWDSVYKFSGTPPGPFWFQVILEPCGDITVQHERMQGPLNSATVGIENQAGSGGLLVVFNGTYITNNNAIKFSYPDSPWITSINPSGGVVDEGDCQTVEVIVDATCIPNGTYEATLSIGNNDLDENPSTVPVQFTIGQLDPPTALTIRYLTASNQLQFNWLGSGAPLYKLYSGTTANGPFDTEVGTTAATQLLTAFPVQSKLFYVVVASDGAGAESIPVRPVSVDFGMTR